MFENTIMARALLRLVAIGVVLRVVGGVARRVSRAVRRVVR